MGAEHEVDWRESADNSLLRIAASNWMADSDDWFNNAFEKLPETVRVNPLRADAADVEAWIASLDAKCSEWYPGPGSCWTLPFARGSAPDNVRQTLISLHETGRLTRQEAVSMIPVIVLRPEPGEVILDMCSSPGSKTTQIAEFLNGEGLVVANERSRKRCNLLISNLQRHRSRSSIVVNHDGRHLPALAGSQGYDAILVDVPCTGSGTTRKNPEVWRQWKPSGGLGLQGMQVGLLNKAIDLARPGGRVVYSTCSIDPIENEGVVSAVLGNRADVVLENIDGRLNGVEMGDGLNSWISLDDELNPLEVGDRCSNLVGFDYKMLSNTKRILGHKMNAGGFFVASIRKREDSPTVIEKGDMPIKIPEDRREASQPISLEAGEKFKHEFRGSIVNLWERGRKIFLGTSKMLNVWKSETVVSNGNAKISGDRWRPLKVIQVGCEIVESRPPDILRVVEKGVHFSREFATNKILVIDREDLIMLLEGGALDRSSLLNGDSFGSGGWLVSDRWDRDPLPVWLGSKITAMASRHERTSRLKLIGDDTPGDIIDE